MNWVFFALLSAVAAGATAVLAKVGVRDVPANLATAIRTLVILVFAWAIVAVRGETSGLRDIKGRTLLFLVLSGIAGRLLACVLPRPTTRTGIAGSPHRQAQPADCRCTRRIVPGRIHIAAIPVYSQVPQWQEMDIRENVRTYAEFEQWIGGVAARYAFRDDLPFAFRIRARTTALTISGMNLPASAEPGDKPTRDYKTIRLVTLATCALAKRLCKSQCIPI